ncbi:hypothetical protein, partial [Burkholderia sp. AW49-1]
MTRHQFAHSAKIRLAICEPDFFTSLWCGRGSTALAVEPDCRVLAVDRETLGQLRDQTTDALDRRRVFRRF